MLRYTVTLVSVEALQTNVLVFIYGYFEQNSLNNARLLLMKSVSRLLLAVKQEELHVIL